MSGITVHPRARSFPEAIIAEPIEVRSPPPASTGTGIGLRVVQLGTPVAAAATGIAYVVIQPRGITALVMIGSSAIGVIAALVGTLSQSTGARRRSRIERDRYRAFLTRVESQLIEVSNSENESNRMTYPDAAMLAQLALDPTRVWERRRSDFDFGTLRVGSGAIPFRAAPYLQTSEMLETELDPDLLEEARLLIERFSTLDDSPTGIRLHDGELVTLLGEPERCRGLLRSLLIQIATLHSSADLRIALVGHPGSNQAWEWAKWLPHVREKATDENGVTGVALIGIAMEPSATDLMLSDILDERASSQPPFLVVVVDGWSPDEPIATSARLRELMEHLPPTSTAILCLVKDSSSEPPHATRRIRLSGDGTGVLEPLLEGGRPSPRFVPDLTDLSTAESIARHLAHYRPAAGTEARNRSNVVRLSTLMNIDPTTFEPTTLWNKTETEGSNLQVAIGQRPDGSALTLDIRDTAYGGMGPNGILIGAPGAGKSELLRSLIAGLALTHEPTRLAFVMVDFKGGTAFAPFVDLPHNAGIVTNLEGDPTMVQRFRDAVLGELDRRQNLFRDAGGDIARYNDHALQAGNTPVPHLLLIVDEFAELMSAFPEFDSFFETVSRLGRGLGIFALLSTQGLQGGLAKLERYISYRLCLRTNNASESQMVIGAPDAARLPRVPGVGLLKVGPSGELQPFKASLVTAALSEGRSAKAVRPFSVSDQFKQNPSKRQIASGPTELSALVERLVATATDRVRPVWRPPLPRALPLDEVLSGAKTRPLQVCIGRADLPRRQQQIPSVIDFANNHSNTLIAGRSGSGRSTALTTIILSFALTHTPEEVQFYCADFGGGLLTALRSLPHVGMVAAQNEPDRIRRCLFVFDDLLESRAQQFAELAIIGPADFRKRRAQGTYDDGFGDVFLVIDNWIAAKEAIPFLEETLLRILTRGPSFGVHALLALDRPNDLRSVLRDRFMGRLQLQPIEPSDGLFDPKVIRTLPKDIPGRALVGDPPTQTQLALPRLDGKATSDAIESAIEEQVAREAQPGRKAPSIQLMPTLVPVEMLDSTFIDTEVGLPIGIEEKDLSPVVLDLSERAQMHIVVYGDAQTGKSSFIDAWVRLACRRFKPSQMVFALFDLRRAHMDAVDGEHLFGQALVPNATVTLVKALEEEFVERFPPQDATATELAQRVHVQRPELFVIIDDEDAAPVGAFQSFVKMIDYSWDCKVHFVVVRRTGMSPHDALSSKLREAGAVTLVLSERSRSSVLPKPMPLPLGRAHLLERDAPPRLVQLVQSIQV